MPPRNRRHPETPTESARTQKGPKLTSNKATAFRAQDLRSGRWICRTSDEVSGRVEWLEDLRSQGRVLSSHVGRRGQGPVVIEATWVHQQDLHPVRP